MQSISKRITCTDACNISSRKSKMNQIIYLNFEIESLYSKGSNYVEWGHETVLKAEIRLRFAMAANQYENWQASTGWIHGCWLLCGLDNESIWILRKNLCFKLSVCLLKYLNWVKNVIKLFNIMNNLKFAEMFMVANFTKNLLILDLITKFSVKPKLPRMIQT